MSFIYPAVSAFALAGPDASHCNDALSASAISFSPRSSYHPRPVAQTSRKSTTKPLVGLGIDWPSEPSAPHPGRVLAGLGLGIDCYTPAHRTTQARRPRHPVVDLLQKRIKARTANANARVGPPVEPIVARELIRRSLSSSPSYDSSAFSARMQSDGSITSASSYTSSTGKRSPSPASDVIYIAAPNSVPAAPSAPALHTFPGRSPAFFTPRAEFAPFDHHEAVVAATHTLIPASAAGQHHNMEIGMDSADSNVDTVDSPVLHYYLPSDLLSPAL